MFGPSLKYDYLKIEKGHICVKNLNVSNEFYDLQVDDVQISFKFSFLILI